MMTFNVMAVKAPRHNTYLPTAVPPVIRTSRSSQPPSIFQKNAHYMTNWYVGQNTDLIEIYSVSFTQIFIQMTFNERAGQRSRYSDCLRAGRSGDRISVATRFSAPVQTGPEAHPASCTMRTGSFPGGKVRPGRDADPSPPSSADVKNRVEL